MSPTAPMSPDELVERLNPLISREIRSISAINTAIEQQKEPDYVILYQETKTGKQASVEQMATLIRSAGGRPSESGGAIEPLLKFQTLLTQKVSTTATLRAMRVVEETLVADYRALEAELERAGGLAHRAMKKVMERSVKHWHVLTAHIAKRRDGDPDEAGRLPHPLALYFAGDEPKACMRCLLDRGGTLPHSRRTSRTRTRTSAAPATTKCSPTCRRTCARRPSAGPPRCATTA